jgi:hypothetical protein
MFHMDNVNCGVLLHGCLTACQRGSARSHGVLSSGGTSQTDACDQSHRFPQEEDLLFQYEEDEAPTTAAVEKKDPKGSYVSMHSSGFRDFLLKPELLKAIGDCGFEHPSEGELTLCDVL